MSLPPLLVRVGYGSWRLWFPLFLLWPLVFVLCVPLFLLAALVLVSLGGESLRRLGRFGAGLYATLCAVRGTQVRVDTPEALIVVEFY
jgi:hypothetical protein